VRSPVTEPVARISTFSPAVTLPVTAPMITTTFAEIGALMSAAGPMVTRERARHERTAATGGRERELPRTAGGYSELRLTTTLKRVVADEQVNVAITGTPRSGPSSPMRQDVMSAVSAITNTLWPGVPAVPMMVMSATDGLHLRTAGIPTYGIQGFFYDRDDIRFHGRDERLKVQSFYEGQTFLYELVKRLSTSQ
jgi:hypothetical protein